MKDPDKEPAKTRSQTKTQGAAPRRHTRAREDEAFTPVIIKRTDETRRHPDDVLQKAVLAGLQQLNRATVSLWLSSLAGGMLVAFSSMAVAVATVAVQPLDLPGLERFAVAAVYPLGFIIAIMSGTELFTEHTATAVYPVLDKAASVRQLLRLWILVLVGNLLGAALTATLLSMADSVIGAQEGYARLGVKLVAFDNGPLLISAVLAGWLMALGAWLILATPPEITQLASIYLVTFLIGLGELHHSIVGAAEAVAALYTSEAITISQAARFLLFALAGNLIGGSIFVALLNYGHIRQTEK